MAGFIIIDFYSKYTPQKNLRATVIFSIYYMASDEI